MNIYMLIMAIAIIILLFMYINTYKKLKIIQNKKSEVQENIKSSTERSNNNNAQIYEMVDKIYESNRKIAIYSGILSEKLENYKEKEYSDIIKRETNIINENLKSIKNK